MLASTQAPTQAPTAAHAAHIVATPPGQALTTTMVPLCPPQKYDWSQHASATVADVGGSTGGLLSALLRAFPGMRGILFDR